MEVQLFLLLLLAMLNEVIKWQLSFGKNNNIECALEEVVERLEPSI